MPELPEVETVKRGLAPAMEGARIANVQLNRENLRFPFPAGFAKSLTDCRIISMGRRAKYLLADLNNGNVLVMHLGMSGSFRVEMTESESRPDNFHIPLSEAGKHDHVIFDLELPNQNARIIYNDPRRFGYMDLVKRSEFDTHRHFKSLGIEPTGNQLNGESLAKLLEGKKAPLKAALLDQRLIAGLGNIYVCEALWRAGLSPTRKSSTISRKGGVASDRSILLAQCIRDIISEAIEAGGSSLRDHRQTDGSLGYFQHTFNVYDREGEVCSKSGCGSKILRKVQSGRSTFYCPSCQR